ncbi:DUF6317 family protein [Kitasatospora viridis]|uniref:Excreted virulence factor EspC (Type VII ESX diderm) n=1 Tax=Kitasatospora viridis TaxID=281105 RepID=A0A561UEV0_9ACTN|nr:DUF6317 family protein [Kitasatospora viridis]TWF97917.1 hypothetical protein FHX73_111719 [Kitasatospora viridis]
MSQYTVVLDDLKGAADTFHQESKTFAGIMPDDGPAQVDGGDGAVNAMMQTVFEALGGLHLAVAGSISNHGDNLQKAHDNYQNCEVSVRELYDDISEPSSVN